MQGKPAMRHDVGAICLAVAMAVAQMTPLQQAQATEAAQASQGLGRGWDALMQHAPAYAAAQAMHDVGQTKSEQARALWRPTVAVNAGVGWASQASRMEGARFSAPGMGSAPGVAFATDIDGGRATSAAIVAQQPLVNGQRDASARQLGIMAALADARWRMDRQQLMMALAQAHVAVLDARQGLRAACTEQDAALRAADAATERFKAGAIPVTARQDALARHDLARAQVLQAEQALRVAELGYQQLTGLPGAEAAGLTGDARAALPTGAAGGEEVQSQDDEAHWQAVARAESPSLRIAALEQDLADVEVARSRPSATWSLDLVARAGEDRLQGHGPDDNGGDAANRMRSRWLGLQLQAPLYTGGMQSAQAREALARSEAARAQRQAAEQTLARDISEAWLDIRTGQARIDAMRQARDSALRRLDATRTGFDVGHRTVLDLLDAERDSQQAQTGLVHTRLQLLLAQLRLAALAGVLDENRLMQADAAWVDASHATTATQP
jgi:outer membrane protein